MSAASIAAAYVPGISLSKAPNPDEHPPRKPWRRARIRAMSTRAAAARIAPPRAALIVYDACRRAMPPADPARRAAIRPVLDAWVTLIGACRARALPIIYTTPG